MKDELTIREAAEILELSPSTVRKRIKRGDIEAEKKPSKYGETYYIPSEEIDRAFREKDVLEFENRLPVEKEEVINELAEALESRNKQLMEDVVENIGKSIEAQNEQLESQQKQIEKQQEAIEELTEQVKELKEQSSIEKSLLGRVKKFFS